MSDVTQILNAIEAGDTQAADRLLPLVYAELRRLAGALMARESPGQTLDATALVHEAYLRMIGSNNGRCWQDHGHFAAAAAQAMRHILIDRARRQMTEKHGGDRVRVPLDETHRVVESPATLLALDEALDRLCVDEPQKAELVKLRFFGGLTTAQAAATLGVSLATADRWWAFAKAWLYAELTDSTVEKLAGV